MATKIASTLPASRDSELFERALVALRQACHLVKIVRPECETPRGEEALDGVLDDLDALIGSVQASAEAAHDDEEGE